MSIINNSYRFIFVHVPKTAGTSVTKALNPLTRYCDLEIGGTAFGESIQPAYRDRFGLTKHSTAHQIRQIVGEDIWQRYFTFAFVRNPFTRCKSTYHFLRRWAGGGKQLFQRMNAFKSFDEYVLSDLWATNPGPDQMFSPQIFWLREHGTKKLLTAFVGRLENLEGDLSHVTRAISAPQTLFAEVPHLNRSPVPAGESSISDDGAVIDKIVEKYRLDFELLGYSMDPSLAVASPSGAL